MRTVWTLLCSSTVYRKGRCSWQRLPCACCTSRIERALNSRLPALASNHSHYGYSAPMVHALLCSSFRTPAQGLTLLPNLWWCESINHLPPSRTNTSRHWSGASSSYVTTAYDSLRHRRWCNNIRPSTGILNGEHKRESIWGLYGRVCYLREFETDVRRARVAKWLRRPVARSGRLGFECRLASHFNLLPLSYFKALGQEKSFFSFFLSLLQRLNI